MTVIEEISRERTAAAALLNSIRDAVEDDLTAVHDAVEGETGLFEAIDAALARLATIDALRDGIEIQIDKLRERDQRLKAQSEAVRSAILIAMAETGLKTLERPQATISRKAVAVSAVITDETLLPVDYFVTPPAPAPKPSKTLILAALKIGVSVPGAALSKPRETIAVRDH